MRASFPTAFSGHLVGKSRESGSFEKGDGVTVSYADGYLVAFESSEGLVQTVQVALDALEKSADFDVSKATRYTAVTVRGDVKLYDDGGAFKPTEVRLAKAA